MKLIREFIDPLDGQPYYSLKCEDTRWAKRKGIENVLEWVSISGEQAAKLLSRGEAKLMLDEEEGYCHPLGGPRVFQFLELSINSDGYGTGRITAIDGKPIKEHNNDRS